MEKQGGILWRIARLHPGRVTLIVWAGYFAIGGYGETVNNDPPVAAAYFTAFMLLSMSYPLFVLLFTSGRFRSRASRQSGRALAAFLAIQIFVSASILAGPEMMTAITDAANEGEFAAILVFMIPFLAVATAFFYLLIGAALALVDAECGTAGGFGRKFGTAVGFLYLIFGVYFIHQRIRQLVTDYENADSIIMDLPMERLVVEPIASGHLSLELTDQPSWESFERYAEELLRRLDARVVERGSTVDMHLWTVEIETVPLRLVYEDFPNRVSLESDSYPGDMLLRKLQARLNPASAI